MNRRFVLVCLLTICGILCLLFFHESDVTELTFSREPGFYNEPFELEIYSPIGTKIYYTLDGSDPDENAILYTDSIMIDDATMHENVYSMRTDLYDADVETLFHSSHYENPDYLIDKCTVIKAAYRDADGNFSEIKSASYFVDYHNRDGYDGINVISVIIDPDNLFDYDTGIYVLGSTGVGNYLYEGSGWERNATIQIFDTGKKLLLNQDCGIRIQGGMTRRLLPRSLNLYARTQYSGTGRFYIDLFHTDYMADTVNLFAGGNDWLSKCRDILVSRLTFDRNFATMNYEPYAMFLDGEYWGFYWLTEKYDDVYLAHYYDVDKNDVIMFKAGALAEGEEADIALYLEMMDYMINADLSEDENYAHACELIDMQSYIDYYATEMYVGHINDWPNLNEAFWRTREVKDGKYEDGKWRWLLFDVNETLLYNSVAEDTLAITMNNSEMFYNLCQNEEFRRQFTTTFMDLVNSTFSPQNTEPIISECVHQMAEPMGIHYQRFFAFADNRKYLNEIVTIQDFFDNRGAYITQYLKSDFGLTGTLVPIVVTINDNAAGSILVNTANITFDENNSWSGKYYTDYPITLEAVANEGYHFVGWENDVSSESNSVELNLSDNGASIIAIFEKSTD